MILQVHELYHLSREPTNYRQGTLSSWMYIPPITSGVPPSPLPFTRCLIPIPGGFPLPGGGGVSPPSFHFEIRFRKNTLVDSYGIWKVSQNHLCDAFSSCSRKSYFIIKWTIVILMTIDACHLPGLLRNHSC